VNFARSIHSRTNGTLFKAVTIVRKTLKSWKKHKREKMVIGTGFHDDPQEEINNIVERIESTREKMEKEALIFMKATERFTEEWIRREIEASLASLGNKSCGDLESCNEKLSELKSGLKELPNRIPSIVEAYLNREDCWIHRNVQFAAGISRDYIEFKKEKMRKELTSSIRMILGCTIEIFRCLKEDESENEGWVKEKGKRKYACILRFSDEMTASLNRYFQILEELFILNHEMKEEILKAQTKDLMKSES
jgi:hypothetical protein